MRILVTGGLGYIGSHTCVSLIEIGHEVLIVDNLSNSSLVVIDRLKKITGRDVMLATVDVRDYSSLKAVFDNFHPEAVIHFAGLKSVTESVREPLSYYDVNVNGTITLLEVMQKCGVKVLVFSSSASVYGDAKIIPISEDADLAPSSPYARTKAVAEQILQDLANNDNEWSIGCLRYFNPLGAHRTGLIGESPNDLPNNLLPYVTQVAIGRREDVKIFGVDYNTPDGTGIRDYIHVVDLAEGHLNTLNYLMGARGLVTLNLGTGYGYSVLEVLMTMEKVLGRPIPSQILDRRAGDVECSIANPMKSQQLLGWKAKFNLYDMCSDAWRWQKINPNGFNEP